MKLTDLEARYIDEVRATGNLSDYFALFYVTMWIEDPATKAGLNRAAKSLIRKGALVQVPNLVTFDENDKQHPLYEVTPEAIEAYLNSNLVLSR